MGRKGKKSGEKGPSPPSPQGPQSSPASKGGGVGVGGKQSSPSEVPRSEVPKDKTSKKQKASPPTKSTKDRETGKANGRESSEDVRKTVGQRRKTSSQGGATAKAEGSRCSVCRVFVLSILVAAAAAAGYAAYVAYPAESQQLIGELDTHARRFARSVSEFVTTQVEKFRNAEPKAADEPASETRKSADDESVESHRHAGESSKEDDEELESRGGRESENAEESDRVEEQIIAEKTSRVEGGERVIEPAKVFEEEEKFEPETVVVEEEDIGEIVEERARETAIDDDDVDDDVEFEEQVASEVEQDDNEFDDEDDVVTRGQAPDQWSTGEEEEHYEEHTDDSRKEDIAGEQIQMEEKFEKEFVEPVAEDDAVEFEEEIDEVLEQDVGEGDDLRWELAGDREEENEETKQHLEKPSDVAFENVHKDGELRRDEEAPERFENVQEMEEHVDQENELKVPEKEDFEKPKDKPLEVPLPEEPTAPGKVPPTKVLSAQEASAEHVEEKLHIREVPGELPEQKVPTQETPEAVILDQEVSREEARIREEPAHDTTSAGDPEVVASSQEMPVEELPNDGEPDLQTTPANVHSSREDLVEEVAQAESRVNDETVDSVPADEKSSEEGIDHRHGRETELEQHEEAQEMTQHAVKEADGRDPEESDFQSRDSSGIQENLEEVNTGELPEVADSAEVQLEKELDYIDEIIDQAPQEAIAAYDLILSVDPESPRAIVGKAKALGILADVEQNDNILEQSIAEYLKVFSLRAVPKSLMVEAGRACAERQSIRGWGSAAAQTLRSLVSMYPDDLELYNELGRKYLVNGAYDEARATFREILNKDPNDAFAMLYLGYIMKSVDHELDQSLGFMRAGLATVPVSDLKFYVELGEALTRTRRHTEALEVYQLAVDRQLLKSIWQRSWFNVDGLSSRIWWTPQQTNYLSNLQVLEDFKNIIHEEVNAILINKSSLFIQDSSDLVENGELKHMKLYINGRKVTENCEAAAKTCGLLDAFSEAVDCKQCEVKFSLLQPGLHLLPRCGPTNCRLTAHLPLVVAPQTRIRVADETRTYGEGGLLIFDDSFEKELWVAGDAPQLLLTIEMWHPDLTFEQRSTLGPL